MPTPPANLERVQGFVWADSAGQDWHVWLDQGVLYTDAEISVLPGGATIFRFGAIQGTLVDVTGANLSVNGVNIFAGTGAPTVSIGTDQSYYLRSDGGHLSAMYQKRAGAWVALV